jgi:hypothetical protein
LTTSSSAKNLKKPTTWEKKLESKYGVAKDDAVAILQIAKFELGMDPKDHASSTQKKQIFKLCRRISAEYGYKDIPKNSKSSKKAKTLDDSDDDDIQPPMSESELTESTEGMTESEGSGEDDPTPVPVKKETTSSSEKTIKNTLSLDVELDDVEALRRKVEALESKMDDLLDVNNKMATNLYKILKAVN